MPYGIPDDELAQHQRDIERDEAEKELAKYSGLPKCQDCGWKLNTVLTNNCSCRGPETDPILHKAAFDRARELQKIIRNNEVTPKY